LQSIASQTYGLHALAAVGVQLPAPSQYEAGCEMPSVQLGVVHEVDVPGGAPQTSRSAPLHSA
jgi:hypothetical protein